MFLPGSSFLAASSAILSSGPEQGQPGSSSIPALPAKRWADSRPPTTEQKHAHKHEVLTVKHPVKTDQNQTPAPSVPLMLVSNTDALTSISKSTVFWRSDATRWNSVRFPKTFTHTCIILWHVLPQRHRADSFITSDLTSRVSRASISVSEKLERRQNRVVFLRQTSEEQHEG